MLLFLFCGGGGIFYACGEGTAMAVNYSCLETSVEYQEGKIVVVFSCACVLCDLIDARSRVNICGIKLTSSIVAERGGIVCEIKK